MSNKILLIDDDIELCDEISEILKDEGFIVDIVNDGKKGYEYVKKGGYDLVLLDLKIPVINGVEVLKKIKNDKIKVKVIILTGRPMGRDLDIEINGNRERNVL